jgi:hypothetical protein
LSSYGDKMSEQRFSSVDGIIIGKASQTVPDFLGDVHFDIKPYGPFTPADSVSDERDQFLDDLPDIVADWRVDEAKRLVFKDAEFVFDFQDRLLLPEATAAILRFCGLSNREAGAVMGKAYSEVSLQYNRARRRCNTPPGINFALSCAGQGYISYDPEKPTTIDNPDPKAVSMELLNLLSEPEATVNRLAELFEEPRTAEKYLGDISRKSLNALGVADIDAAVLSLMTHGRLALPERFAQPEFPEKQVYSQLKDNLRQRVITFNGAKLTFKTGQDLPGIRGGIAMMLAFGSPVKDVLAATGLQPYSAQQQVDEVFSVINMTSRNRAQSVRPFFERYVNAVNHKEYRNPSNYRLSSSELELIRNISQKTKAELSRETGIPVPGIESNLRILREKMQVKSDASLVWIALLEGRL